MKLLRKSGGSHFFDSLSGLPNQVWQAAVLYLSRLWRGVFWRMLLPENISPAVSLASGIVYIMRTRQPAGPGRKDVKITFIKVKAAYIDFT